MKRYFGIDLRDLFSEVDPLSPAWALMHAQTLPLGSAFMAELRGGKEFRGWDETRYMTARLIDVMNILKHITILANMDPDAEAPELPDPYPTPGSPKANKPEGKRPKQGSFGHMAGNLLEKAKARKAAQK